MRTFTLPILFCMTMASGVSHGQVVISLNMTQLPSNQSGSGPNWTYVAGPTTPLPETPTFAVGLNSMSQPTLFMNTMPDDLASPDSNGYFLNGMLNPAQPEFQVSLRAAILQDETAGNHFGLSTIVNYGGKTVGIGFGPTQLQASDSLGVHDIITGLNNTGYHDYLLSGNITTGAWTLLRDSIIVGSGTMLNEPTFNRLYLGDGSGASNAQAEITQYTFTSVPEPTSVTLLLFAASTHFILKCRRRFRK